MISETTIIVDIDGTVADIRDRLHFITGDTKDYDSFYEACVDDKPIESICKLVYALFYAGANIVFMTGRPHRVHDKTRTWIDQHMPLYGEYTLLMRQNNDYRKDYIVKHELYSKFLQGRDIEFILEDRSSVVKMWRDLGFTVLQVADGEY